MEELGKIIALKELREELLERAEDLKAEYRMSGHQAISNRISEIYEIVELIQNKVHAISPADCDW